jgi:hypothetical protein
MKIDHTDLILLRFCHTRVLYKLKVRYLLYLHIMYKYICRYLSRYSTIVLWLSEKK